MTSHAAHKPHAGTHRRSVALFGGTFDPIHAGHITVAQAAQKRFHLDAIYFIPSSRPPHKIEAGAHAVRSSLCDGGARLCGSSGICAVARRSARRRRRPARLLHHRHRAPLSPRASRRSSVISFSAPISFSKSRRGKITKRCSIPAISSSPAARAFAWTRCAS